MIGKTLGHYQITEKLGEGGMGVVYRARDPRLGRDVAIKVLPGEVTGGPERLQRFEREARTVAALNHPNILTVFDVGMHEGSPYVVTELLEGETLRAFVSRHSPTPRQVLAFMLQAARGLEAAHAKGIIHRDIKPENLFVTTNGRVKVLDFGLAKLTAAQAREASEATESNPTGEGQLLGTPGYMSPEQVRGLPLDARSDVFSFGVVLYELLSARHPFRRETPMGTLSAILEETPPELLVAARQVSPQVAAIVARCLEKPREERFASGHDLVVALEAVTAGASGLEAVAAGIEERSPYPGLSSFTEKDAAHFFGREEEVKALWQRLQNRKLLAVIGPSGTGKTSFVRAGVVPAAPEGWRCLWVTPGNRPFAAVVSAFVPELSSDPETLQRLVRAETGEEMTAALGVWRRRHGEALLVVDQLEELFTLNRGEVQERFAVFLSRLASEADVHVLISLRDDFLMRCQEQPALMAIFTELTPLGALTKEGLRRALEEPAKKLGYSFEGDALVDEMVESVEGARAALPLLAFSVSRLWEKRDRERKLLTRAAYEEIGGVAGALAQHAEAVMDRIGLGQEVVREIFRNLVTAQGTRAVVDRDELLSAFPEKGVAEEALRELIDARLVTSYEVEGREGEASHHRVEVVHESLLKAWPRLVWWQAQDEEGAVLRDQLKQAAHLWEEKGRPADMLWSGTSFREYELWRERYPGALTALEEAFAKAMAERARRRKRLLMAAVAAVIAVLVCVAVAIGISRQEAVRQAERAERQTGLAEASKLLALGQLKLEDDPNAALAYAIASLERSDNDSAHRFAVEALWQGPPARYFPRDLTGLGLAWSPDGRWIAFGGGSNLVLLNREAGERRQLSSSDDFPVGFTSDGQRLVTIPSSGAVTGLRVWAIPEGRVERTLPQPSALDVFLVDDRLLTFALDGTGIMRRLSLDGSTEQILGRLNQSGLTSWSIDPSGTWIYSLQRGRVVQQRLDTLAAPARVIGAYEGDAGVRAAPWRERAVAGDIVGEVRIWDVPFTRVIRTLKSPASARFIALDPKERFLAAGPWGAASLRSVFVFDLAAPRTAEPAPLLGEWTWMNDMKFSSDGSWLATVNDGALTLWNMGCQRSTVLGRQKAPFVVVAFTPDGHLLSSSDEGVLRRWPLSSADGEDVREYRPGANIGMSMDLDRQGRIAVLVERVPPEGKVLVVPLDGAEPVTYHLKDSLGVFDARLDPGGRLVAVVGRSSDPSKGLDGIRLLDLNTHAERTLDTYAKGAEGCFGGDMVGFVTPVWLPDGRLITDGDAGLRVWDLATGVGQLLRPCRRTSGAIFALLATPDSRSVLRLDMASKTAETSSLSVFDLASRKTREISTHGNVLTSFALDATGTILVSGDRNGVVRVGPVTGGEPHLLFGHTAAVTGVAVSPDGRWIASGSDDGTIRLWPMPDLSKAPLHTLPPDELLAKLKSLTNLRAVRDPSSDTGWKIEIGHFPGWAVVPDWQP